MPTAMVAPPKRFHLRALRDLRVGREVENRMDLSGAILPPMSEMNSMV